jgi:hypothetical protein
VADKQAALALVVLTYEPALMSNKPAAQGEATVCHVKEAESRTGSAIPLSCNPIRSRVQRSRQSRLPPPDPVIGSPGHFGAIAKPALGAPKSVGAIAFTLWEVLPSS